MGRFTGVLGIVAILLIAFLFSTNRRAIKPRILFWGLGLQLLFAVVVLKTGFGAVFQKIGEGVNAMLGYSVAGSEFVFGPLGNGSGPFPQFLQGIKAGSGGFFAFQGLPIVIF